ncbi:MAG TPA: DUF5684 domain-containing protein [Microthrixaceae bacterium]|nr:DUF5684 domain-containing protein [Microthrixaceae bacterium]HMT24065.1 DUF5684 domain-containing protein [Microthrixaceae bacterium]HMT60278.1 DUF5684 domain-containing protein [Microthrixaceae bacterium]
MNGNTMLALILLLLLPLLVAAIELVSTWKIFVKMGDEGWMSIVPFLNIYRIFQRSRPDQAILWTILTFACGIGAFVAVFDLAKLFGKEIGYALGLIFLPFVFLPMLAFGSATYQGPPAPQLG